MVSPQAKRAASRTDDRAQLWSDPVRLAESRGRCAIAAGDRTARRCVRIEEIAAVKRRYGYRR
jgi:hypothetical protein